MEKTVIVPLKQKINYKDYPILLFDSTNQRVVQYREILEKKFNVLTALTHEDAFRSLEDNTKLAAIIAYYDEGEKTSIEFFEHITGTHPDISRIIMTENYESQKEYLGPSIEDGTVYKIMEKTDNLLITVEIMNAVERFVLLNEKKIFIEERESFEQQTMIGDLAARFAHELRNPLAIISLNTEMSLNRIDPGADKLEKSMQQILKQCQRLSDLIDKIMSFSKEIRGNFVSVNLDLLLNDAILLYSICYPAVFHNIQIQKQISPKISDVWGIRILLIRVFLKLLRYLTTSLTPKETIYIKASVTKDEDEIEIEIKNTHSEIILEELKIYRDVFNHIDEKEDMALYISNMILESHGGYLEMGTVEGEGSIMKIHLPLDPNR
ncbi:MAG: sensor histidine kinase [bacterium]